MTRAGIYVRISEDPFGTSAAPERQEADCRRLCEERGWDVVEVYGDRNLSAYKAGVRREQYERMLSDADNGKLDCIVVWKLDRLSRSVSDFTTTWKRLERINCNLVAVHDTVDTTTPMGKAAAAMSMVFAELESDTTSLRVREAEAHRARRGLPHGGGSRPYGYTMGRTEIVPEEATIIVEAVDRFIDGESLFTICDDLNARGEKTTRGKPWSTRGLSQMLRSPGLKGVRAYRGREYDGTWEAILSADRHHELLVALSAGWSDERRRAKFSHLLTGLAHCGRCGQPLRWNPGRNRNGKDYPRYQCWREPGKEGCQQLSVSERLSDEMVTGIVLAHIAASPDLGSVRDDAELALVADELTKKRDARLRLEREHFQKGAIDYPSYSTLHAEMSDEIERLDARLAYLSRSDSVPSLDGIADWWPESEVVTQRQVLRLFVERVVIHPVGKGGSRFDPKRVEIVWSE